MNKVEEYITNNTSIFVEISQQCR